jgi:DNA-3-methyladenine glycosylase II
MESLREAERHLSTSCSVMAGLISVHGTCTIAEEKSSPFQTLASSIISQQLSAKAAGTIKGRVLSMMDEFDPDGFLSVPSEDLRKAGLSAAKTKYILEIASRVKNGTLDFEKLRHESDENVIQFLTALPGVGRWTADIFLMFGLKRPNILAIGDAGLQRAARLLYGADSTLEAVSHAWQPYCSVASWYLWHHLDAG